MAEVVDREGIVRPPDVLKVGNLEDRSGRISADWADDPETLAAINAADATKTAGLNAMIKDRLRLLVQQLEGLPLMRGETDKVVEKLMKVLPRSAPDT